MGTNNDLVFQIEIPIVDHRACQEAYAPLKRKVTKDMICAGEKEGKRLAYNRVPPTRERCRALQWRAGDLGVWEAEQ